MRAIGSLQSLKREGPHAAALARVVYRDRPKECCWLLVIKGCLVPAELSLDLKTYAALNQAFPNHSTLDQFLSDEQWESYRLLGELIGKRVFTPQESGAWGGTERKIRRVAVSPL